MVEAEGEPKKEIRREGGGRERIREEEAKLVASTAICASLSPLSLAHPANSTEDKPYSSYKHDENPPGHHNSSSSSSAGHTRNDPTRRFRSRTGLTKARAYRIAEERRRTVPRRSLPACDSGALRREEKSAHECTTARREGGSAPPPDAPKP